MESNGEDKVPPMSHDALHPPEDAFIRELTLSQSVLRGFCQSSLGNDEDAKEALQRTNVVLWKKSASWDPATPFLRWAVTVAKFVVLGMVRDRQRERLLFEADVEELMLEEAVEEMEGFDPRKDALRTCLSKLKAAHQTILSEHYVAGRSVKEIASAYQMGVSAVKVLMLRLRHILGDCIEQQVAIEERL
jgi:RNA polymerase sigma-70 factor (ECF subfamily)